MTTKRKNVLLISLDDCVAYWDYKTVFKEALQTPNLDRICSQSTAFRATYCPAPVCGPSRACLMSGLAPHQSGVISNDEYAFDYMAPKQMWSYQLKKNGYFCSSGGKVHHLFGPLEGKYHNVLYDDEPKPFGLFDWHPTKFKSGTSLGGHRGGYATTDPAEDEIYYDARSAASAIDFLSNYDGDAPFYREVGFYSPHGPHVTPIRFKEMYDADKLTQPPAWKHGFDSHDFTRYALKETKELAKSDTRWWQCSVRNYFSALSHVDYHLGRVWDALQASPHAENTVVVILSDHGFHLGNLNRFCKKTLWEQVARVPLIVYDPSKPKAREVTDPVSLVDVGPTVLDLAGIKSPKAPLGKSLRPLLDGQSEADRVIPTFLRDNVAIRKGKYRFIRYRDGSTQLYDLDKDFWQLKDLGTSHPAHSDLEKQLYATSRDWGFEIPDPVLPHPLVRTAEAGKPTPKFAHKNTPHKIHMAKSHTEAEEHVMAADKPLSKFDMKKPLGALTMVYKDYDLLERWYNYYKAQIGAENIFIYSHGNDPKHREIAPDANVMNVPRDESFTLFEVSRWRMMGFFASAMLEFYQYMIVSDVDEFVIADPKTGGNVAEYIQKHYNGPKAPKNISPLGLEIVHVPDQEPEPIVAGSNVLSRRRFFRPSRNYSKPCIVGGPVSFGPGGHRNTLGPRHMPDDLYLVHLKFYDLPTVENRANQQREILKTIESEGGFSPETHPWFNTLENFHMILDRYELSGEDIEQTAFRDRMKTFQTEKYPGQYVWGYIKAKKLFELPERFGNVF